MKRSKHKRVTTTQQYVGEARRDKYWTQWAERRMDEMKKWPKPGGPCDCRQCPDCQSRG